ncbi:hypothetical protein HMPREF0262_02469 [Clostridium sp. ATCC 29733]|nr:hypothetical protein HMPREF0262_02469 [Clostridium sp. ATCC 29733]
MWGGNAPSPAGASYYKAWGAIFLVLFLHLYRGGRKGLGASLQGGVRRAARGTDRGRPPCSCGHWASRVEKTCPAAGPLHWRRPTARPSRVPSPHRRAEKHLRYWGAKGPCTAGRPPCRCGHWASRPERICPIVGPLHWRCPTAKPSQAPSPHRCAEKRL